MTYLEILKCARIAVKQEAETSDALAESNRKAGRNERAAMHRENFDDCRKKLGEIDTLIEIETRK